MTERTDRYGTNWPIVGHGWAIQRIARALNAGRLRHAYLISGPASIGKTAFARAFAQAVNCLDETPGGRPCGQCRACNLIAHDTHADFSLVQADEGTLRIEQVRDMQRTLTLRPVEGRYRVVVLRRFQEASQQAMDALLKTLEEPPPYVLIIVTADTTENILATIKSRCQPIPLRPIPAPLIREALETYFNVESEQAALLAQLSGGRMGWAVRAMQDETVLAQRAAWLDKLEQALGETRAGRFALADGLSKDSKDKGELAAMLNQWQCYWRDVLLLSHITTTPITNRDRRHALEQIAREVKRDDAARVLHAIRRTGRYLEQNVNTRLALDVLMLDLPRLRLFPAP